MPQTMTSALVAGQVAAGHARATSYRYTAFVLCASLPPLFATGFLIQLLAHAAAGLLDEWRLTPLALAKPLAMAPAGLLAGAALGQGLRQPPWRVLLWSGVAVSVFTSAVAFARTPIEVGTLCLLASMAAGVALLQTGDLTSCVLPGRRRWALSAVAATLLAAGGTVAAWFVGADLVDGWRSALIVIGVLSAASPLAVLGASVAARSRLSDSAVAEASAMDELAAAGTRATFAYLIGTAHARETLTLFAVACCTGVVAGMAALSMPLALVYHGMPATAAASWLSTLNLAAIAGAVAAGGLLRVAPGRGLCWLTATAALVAGLLAIAEGTPPATALRLALIVCGFVTAAAPVTALRLAAAYGPPGAHAAVRRAAVAFIALGAMLGGHAGVHAAHAGGADGFLAAWAGGFGVVAMMAALLPPPRSRRVNSSTGFNSPDVPALG